MAAQCPGMKFGIKKNDHKFCQHSLLEHIFSFQSSLKPKSSLGRILKKLNFKILMFVTLHFAHLVDIFWLLGHINGSQPKKNHCSYLTNIIYKISTLIWPKLLPKVWQTIPTYFMKFITDSPTPKLRWQLTNNYNYIIGLASKYDTN